MIMLMSGCSHKRYVPVVKYSHPSHSALKTTLRSKHGDRYVYAGQGPHRFDCSGLIYYSYATMNLWLPRRAIDQSKVGKTIPINELRYGDLIFFDTHRHFGGRVNHAGIYVGNGRFTHASSAKRRVTTSSLRKHFYRSRVVVCKRLIPTKKSHISKPTKLLKVKNTAVTKIVNAPIDTAVSTPEVAPTATSAITPTANDPITATENTQTSNDEKIDLF